jgi:thiamine biosynthesis lipoprotein
MKVIIRRVSKPSLLILSVIVIFVGALASCADAGEGDSAPALERDFRAGYLGTVVTISSYDAAIRQLFDDAFALVADIDARMSVNRQDNEIAEINRGGETPVAVSEDTYGLIRQALEYSELSGGAFDISVGPVMELWKSGGEFSVRPAASDIESRLPLIDYRRIILDEAGVRLDAPGMKIDLGGVAKGYACDKTLDYLKGQNISSALLDFGGNIYAHGVKPDGSEWKVGIRSPMIGENDVVCALSARDKAVVTSGGYERYFEEDGTVYHHILDTKTGYPAESGLLSVTIVDPSSTRADALSTACFVLGLDAGGALLESLPESEGIFITDGNKIYTTPGLTAAVTLADSRFELEEYAKAGGDESPAGRR